MSIDEPIELKLLTNFLRDCSNYSYKFKCINIPVSVVMQVIQNRMSIINWVYNQYT